MQCMQVQVGALALYALSGSSSVGMGGYLAVCVAVVLEEESGRAQSVLLSDKLEGIYGS